MHTAAIDAEDGFGCESGVDPMLQGFQLDYQAIGHHVVSHGEGVSIAHINFVLAGGDLVMGILNTDAHLLQGEHSFSPQVGGGIPGGHIEIAALIQGLGFLVIFKVEVFQFGADIEGVAKVGCPLQGLFQDISGVTLEGLAAGSYNIAENSSFRVFFRAPGEQLEGIGVGQRHHIAFIDTGKPFN